MLLQVKRPVLLLLLLSNMRTFAQALYLKVEKLILECQVVDDLPQLTRVIYSLNPHHTVEDPVAEIYFIVSNLR